MKIRWNFFFCRLDKKEEGGQGVFIFGFWPRMGSHKKILLIDKVRLYLLCLVGETVVWRGITKFGRPQFQKWLGKKYSLRWKWNFPEFSFLFKNFLKSPWGKKNGKRHEMKFLSAFFLGKRKKYRHQWQLVSREIPRARAEGETYVRA